MTGLMNDRDAGVYKVTFAFAGGECFQVVWDWGRKSSGEEA